ncbi:MAG TPA: hypothetical protein VJB18_09190 [Burkholderiales bacterium]|nr:hypothetical protein [Burkholderiales bacterium]
MSKNIIQALISSVVVAILLAFVSMTIASGSLSDILTHPGFWVFYAKSFSWLFFVGFLASALTVLLISRQG